MAAVTAGADPVASTGELRRQEIAGLLVRAQEGDRPALDEIVRRLMPLVWNVARAQGLDADTASDAVQNVWVLLLRNLDGIHTPRALTGWLVTVARREAHRLRTAQRRLDPVEPAELEELARMAGSNNDDDALVEVQDQYRCLWRNLGRLSPRCQELLRVVAYADRPDYTVVSQSLRMPKGSIGPTRGRCLARLRRLLDEDPTWSLR